MGGGGRPGAAGDRAGDRGLPRHILAFDESSRGWLLKNDSDFKRRSIEGLTLTIMIGMIALAVVCVALLFVRYLIPWACPPAGIIFLSFP